MYAFWCFAKSKEYARAIWLTFGQGETVIDLGSGAGFDVFLAAKAVGSTGKVVGVDMNKVRGPGENLLFFSFFPLQ